MDNQSPAPTSEIDYWLGKIANREDALRAIKDVSVILYLMAVFQIGLGFLFSESESFVNAAILAVPAFLLRKFNSRVVAIVLLLFAISCIVFIGTNMLGGRVAGNIMLTCIVTWASIRSIRATFKLHKLQNSSAL